MSLIDEIQPGDKLPNGAILLRINLPKSWRPGQPPRFIVLALHAGAGAEDPFCTWECGGDGVTYWGHYSPDLEDALEDFNERIR
jgi:hypothetical protein